MQIWCTLKNIPLLSISNVTNDLRKWEGGGIKMPCKIPLLPWWRFEVWQKAQTLEDMQQSLKILGLVTQVTQAAKLYDMNNKRYRSSEKEEPGRWFNTRVGNLLCEISVALWALCSVFTVGILSIVGSRRPDINKRGWHIPMQVYSLTLEINFM